MPTLDPEFDYYLDHQEELVERFRGQFVVIKRDQVLGAYPTVRDALTETVKKHKEGTFLIQKCLPGDENTQMVFHSRVSFP